MSNLELDDKLADYAFGNMSETESKAFAAALQHDPDLAAEYATVWQPVIAALPLAAAPVQLPAMMRQRVLEAALQSEPAAVVLPRSAQAGGTVAPQMQAATLQPTAPTPPLAPRPSPANSVGAAPVRPPLNGFPAVNPWRRLVVLFSRPQLALSSMALMLIVSLVSVSWAVSLNAQHESDMAHINQQQAAINALITDRNAHMVALQPTDNWKAGYGRAVYDPNQSAVYVILSGPPPKTAMDCQLWGMKKGQATSIAVFTMNGWSASYMAHAPANLKSYDGLMLTWEKPGGATQPDPHWIMLEGPVQNN